MQSVPLLSGHVRGPHLALLSPNSCRPLARWLSCSESSWVLSFRVRVWLRAHPPPPCGGQGQAGGPLSRKLNSSPCLADQAAVVSEALDG